MTPETPSQSDVRLRTAVGALVKATSLKALSEGTQRIFEQAVLQSLSSTVTNIDFNATAAGFVTNRGIRFIRR